MQGLYVFMTDTIRVPGLLLALQNGFLQTDFRENDTEPLTTLSEKSQRHHLVESSIKVI
jgi:hypothetical protein